jgi:signal transduction histidine kinase
MRPHRLSYHRGMHELLRSVWDEPRPPGPPPLAAWRDRALVAVLVSVSVLEGLLRPDLPWRVLAVAVAVSLAPLMLWRRSRPLLAVAIAFTTCAVASLVIGADLALNSLAFLVILPYSLARWGAAREVLAGFAIVLGKLALSLSLGYINAGESALGGALVFAAVALGAAVRYRATVRMRELAQVKLLERERLARDLHDTVAHHVSAIAIRAQAGLAVAAVDPGAATDALRIIEAEASRALTEMRTMVRTLRRDEPDRVLEELAPTPGVRDLERLAGRARGGPVVDVELRGDVTDLPPAVGSAIFRLAQESVTNARRHARHATRIAVSVAADETSVRLTVTDDGDTSAVRPHASSGFGLVGMAERADLLGGTCEAGPAAGRGWTVRAVLPLVAQQAVQRAA